MKAAQPLHKGRIDLDGAMETFAWMLDLFELSERCAPAPLYTGGLYDAWPNMVAEGLGICREELAAVKLYERGEELANG